MLAACADEQPGLSDWQVALETDAGPGILLGVWGARSDDVLAVGGQQLADDRSRGTALRWDGGAWTPVTLPTRTPLLQWVFGLDDEVWAVGEEGAVVHRVGGEWTLANCGSLPLWGVWGASADELWAVGGGSSGDPVICRSDDGARWQRTELPARGSSGTALYRVWGAAADDVWAVGDRGLALHWDGAAWTEHDAGTTFDLLGVWGNGPDDVLAVGGRASGVLARWDGARWTAEELPDVPGLSGVWMAPDGGATVTGADGYAADLAAGEWTPVRRETSTSLLLHATFGLPGEHQFAVGGSFDELPPYTGVVLDREL